MVACPMGVVCVRKSVMNALIQMTGYHYVSSDEYVLNFLELFSTLNIDEIMPHLREYLEGSLDETWFGSHGGFWAGRGKEAAFRETFLFQ